MNIQDTRVNNLQKAIGSFGEHGRIAAFAEKTGMNESYLSQLLCGTRTIGEKSARNIEQKAGLEKYSLDKQSDTQHINAATIDSTLRDLLTEANMLPPDIRETLVKSIRASLDLAKRHKSDNQQGKP